MVILPGLAIYSSDKQAWNTITVYTVSALHPSCKTPHVILHPVVSAEVTGVIGNPLDDQLPDLYIEIRLSGSDFLQRTRVIRQSKTPSWNEELLPLYVPDHTFPICIAIDKRR